MKLELVRWLLGFARYMRSLFEVRIVFAAEVILYQDQ